MTEIRDVGRTHPQTGETFGFRFQRGAVAADGEEQRPTQDATAADVTHDTAEDVTHDTAEDVTHDTAEDEATTRSFRRGTESQEGDR